MIALIPARGGSKRVPRKNLRVLAGHPLLAYTIAAARDAGCFDRILVSTEDREIAHVARHYGAEVIDRPPEFAADTSPDVQWLRHALDVLDNPPMVSWALLRPTSPFRTAETIRRAWRQFRLPDQTADSLRAVEPVTQHPGKMWTADLALEYAPPIKPLLDKKHPDGTPWHSSPTQTLPVYYVQNASLEMGWGGNIWTYGTIHGKKVAPFLTRGYEGFDLNHERDFREADYLLASGEAVLPPVDVDPVSASPWGV
jgi:CMP-N,N'-diacetyllegionaminic acid synthase